MFIGIIKIELRFPPVVSIKDKRKIVQRVKMKLVSKFKISIAEIDDQDLYNSAIFGLCFVSNKNTDARNKGQNIIRFLENNESDTFYDYNFVVEDF